MVMTGNARLRASRGAEHALEPLEPQVDRLRMHPFLVGQPLLEAAHEAASDAQAAAGSLPINKRSMRADAVAHVAPVDDHVERAVLEQELAALEAFRQGLAHGLLDDARPGEADQRLRLGDVEVAEHREARRHAARGRVGHHRDERQARLATGASARRWSWPSAAANTAPPACARRRSRRSTPAAGGARGSSSTARMKLSPTTEPIEPPRNWNSNAQATTRQAVQRARHHDQRVALAGVLLRLHEAVLVALAVLELERILGLDLGGDLLGGSGSRNFSSRSRAPMRMWWLHLGQTWRLRSISARYSTASQAGHLIHSPSGTERVRRSVLMREGTIRSNQVMR